MDENPPSNPEMWYMLLVGYACGMFLPGFITLATGSKPSWYSLSAIGVGMLGAATLGYLWYTRENYWPYIRGETEE